MNERSIRLKTSWLPDDVLLLEHATLNEELGRPFEYQLELLSLKNDLAVCDAMWAGVSICVDLPSGGTRYFNGHVTSFARGELRGEYTRYRATVRPWVWLLTRAADCRIFQDMTVPQIVKRVCSDLGFDDVDDSFLHERYRTLEYVVQYRETSFDFISRLMEQEGIYYSFRHTADQTHVMVLAESPSSHAAVKGYETIAYLPAEALQSGARGEVEHISGWQVSRQVQPLSFTLDDFNFETPKAGLRVNVPAGGAAGEDGGAAFELYDYPGLYGSPKEGNRVVKVMMEERRALVERASGAGNARGLTTGALFTLADYTVDDQNKEYLVLSTSCALAPNLFESGTQAGGPEFQCTFVAMDSQRQFRAARRTPRPVVQGPQTAIVVGEDKEEITTDKYGRVKIQFHWDRQGKHDQDSSCWVRVAQLWAGAGWGAMHIPRIGQEVIVEFLEGDPDRPIVTGRVYNGDNMPPYKLPDNKTQSGIKSRSTLGGGPGNFNEIRFEDKRGGEELHIQAERDQTTLVKHDRRADVGANDTVRVGGDRTVTVGGNLSVIVKGGGEKPSRANADWDVTGTYHVKASDTIEIEAPTHIRLTCGGSSILVEPGKITLEAGGKAQVILDANVVAQSSAGSKVALDAGARVGVSGGAQVALDSNILAQAAGGANVTVDGTKIQIAGQAEVDVSAGSGVIKASGPGVEIHGAMVTLNG